MAEKPESPSRRRFLFRSGATLGGGVLALSLPGLLAMADEARAAFETGQPFNTLTADEAAVIDAFAAQIVPSVEGLGAKEAGAVHFIDRALGDELSDLLPLIRGGVADLQLKAQTRFETAFSDLEAESQVALMKQIETTEFFEELRFLTLAGMLTHPSYGGNRDRIGWKLIGFDDRHFWQPPFGYYDANYQDPYRHDH